MSDSNRTKPPIPSKMDPHPDTDRFSFYCWTSAGLVVLGLVINTISIFVASICMPLPLLGILIAGLGLMYGYRALRIAQLSKDRLEIGWPIVVVIFNFFSLLIGLYGAFVALSTLCLIVFVVILYVIGNVL